MGHFLQRAFSHGRKKVCWHYKQNERSESSFCTKLYIQCSSHITAMDTSERLWRDWFTHRWRQMRGQKTIQLLNKAKMQKNKGKKTTVATNCICLIHRVTQRNWNSSLALWQGRCDPWSSPILNVADSSMEVVLERKDDHICQSLITEGGDSRLYDLEKCLLAHLSRSCYCFYLVSC